MYACLECLFVVVFVGFGTCFVFVCLFDLLVFVVIGLGRCLGLPEGLLVE